MQTEARVPEVGQAVHVQNRLATVRTGGPYQGRAGAFGRAGFARRFRGAAGYGRDHTRRGLMYGFRPHARATPAGAIVAFDRAPANVSDLAMVGQLGPPPGSVGVGDRGYWSP